MQENNDEQLLFQQQENTTSGTLRFPREFESWQSELEDCFAEYNAVFPFPTTEPAAATTKPTTSPAASSFDGEDPHNTSANKINSKTQKTIYREVDRMCNHCSGLINNEHVDFLNDRVIPQEIKVMDQVAAGTKSEMVPSFCNDSFKFFRYPTLIAKMDPDFGGPEAELVNVFSGLSDAVLQNRVYLPTKEPTAQLAKSMFGNSDALKRREKVKPTNPKRVKKQHKLAAAAIHSGKMWDDADRPTRPRSAYNYFFQHERVKMLQESRNNSSSNATTTTPSPNNATITTEQDTKGKVGFATLGRQIGKKWKAVDKGTRATFQKVANLDMKRYKEEKEAYLTRKRKREQAAAKDSSSSSNEHSGSSDTCL